jgi:CubicO group peptidase (beta-lactamase class C family)
LSGEDIRYGWGFGGQMLYVVPGLDMSVVMTSDTQPSGGASGHRDALHQLLGDIIEAVRSDS